MKQYQKKIQQVTSVQFYKLLACAGSLAKLKVGLKILAEQESIAVFSFEHLINAYREFHKKSFVTSDQVANCFYLVVSSFAVCTDLLERGNARVCVCERDIERDREIER